MKLFMFMFLVTMVASAQTQIAVTFDPSGDTITGGEVVSGTITSEPSCDGTATYTINYLWQRPGNGGWVRMGFAQYGFTGGTGTITTPALAITGDVIVVTVCKVCTSLDGQTQTSWCQSHKYTCL